MAGKVSRLGQASTERTGSAVFIYALTEPDGAPRYIGQSNDPARRFNEHRLDGKREVRAWFAGLAAVGAVPGLRILATCSPETADEIEAATILALAAKYPLLNRMPGVYGPAAEPSDGHRLLSAFLEARGLSQAQVARRLGVTKVAVHYWRTGRATPRLSHREALASWSDGAVPSESWGPLRDPRRGPFPAVVPFSISSLSPTADTPPPHSNPAAVAPSSTGTNEPLSNPRANAQPRETTSVAAHSHSAHIPHCDASACHTAQEIS